ncbi:hypothetical protein L6164_027035 [Bauhinia variegata]|nr:hypothetical protein L6164_027035 [Bauhinia variegata]
MAGQDWQPIWEPRPEHPDMPIFPQPERSIYRGGEFGYTRLVATKEKLVLSYVGNHDGQVHDRVEILASGEVVSGGKPDCENVESSLSWYVKAGIILVLGALIGYIIGFISHSRNKLQDKREWTPVKTVES